MRSQSNTTMALFIFVKTMAINFVIKGFLGKKQFFLHWIRHRYQSKTCVEQIEQVMDKSLINSTYSSMNLQYFLDMKVIFFKYCKKCARSQVKKILTFLVEFMDMSGLTF